MSVSSQSSAVFFTLVSPERAELLCERCQRSVSLPREWAGGRVRCPECRAPLYLPRRAGFGPLPPARAAARVAAPEPAPALELAPERPRADLEAAFRPRRFSSPLTERRQRLARLAAQRDLRCEARLVGTGVVLQLLALLHLPGVAICWTLGARPQALITLVVAAALGVTGFGLARLRPWSRPAALGILGLTSLLGLVAACAGGGWVAVLQVSYPLAVVGLLLHEGGRSFGPDYQACLEETSHVQVPWASTPWFWIPGALTLISLILSLFALSAALAAAAALRAAMGGL